jgi:hypothetical protein
LKIISPAGFENFFRELSEMVAAGPLDFREVADLTDRYGVQDGEPDWLPGIISRYGLTATS